MLFDIFATICRKNTSPPIAENDRALQQHDPCQVLLKQKITFEEAAN